MRFFTKKAPERAFPGAHTGSGYTRFAHGATLRASPPLRVTIPNANAGLDVILF